MPRRSGPRTFLALVLLLGLVREGDAQSLIFRTDDGGTARTRMSISNAAGTATLLVTKSRVTFDTTGGLIGYLNLPATASTTAGDIWYSGGSVLYRDASGNQTLVTGSTGFLQNGNSYGAGAVLGTNDANGLSFETSGTTKMTLNTSGMLLPSANNTYDFGSTTARWRDVFLDGDVKTSAGTVRYIQNQTAAAQAASFRVSGTGELSGTSALQLRATTTNTNGASTSAIYAGTNGSHAGWNLGLEVTASNSTVENRAIHATASGPDGSNIIGGYFSGSCGVASASTVVYGLYATSAATGGSNTCVTYGLRSSVTSGGGGRFGVSGEVQDSSTAPITCRGIQGTAVDTGAVTTAGTDRNYGGYFSALKTGVSTVTLDTYGVFADAQGDANGTSTCYGIYASASGADTNWAGYFNGNVYVSGSISIGGTTDPFVNETGDTMTGDLTMSSADVLLSSTTDQLRVTHTSNAYVILVENTTNYGIYWNATSNYFSFYGAGVERARVDLDNGGFQTDGWSDFSSTTDASGTAGTGAVQVGGSLRFDGNEIITNTGTTLYLNNNNSAKVEVGSELDVNITANWGSAFEAHSADALSAGRFYNYSLLTSQDVVIVRGGPNTNPGTGVDFIQFYDGDGTGIGSIDGDGSGGIRYNTTSDRRLKQDIVPLAGALETLRRLQPREYAFKTNPGARQHGFIAQELHEVYPQLVSGEPDGDPETDPMMVDYGRLTPLLAAGVKDLHSIVESQQAEIERLRHDLDQVNRRLDALGAR